MIGMGFSQAGLAEALPGVKGLGASWPYGTALFELSCRLRRLGLEPGCGLDRAKSNWTKTGSRLFHLVSGALSNVIGTVSIDPSDLPPHDHFQADTTARHRSEERRVGKE